MNIVCQSFLFQVTSVSLSEFCVLVVSLPYVSCFVCVGESVGCFCYDVIVLLNYNVIVGVFVGLGGEG